ncbi:hypothetical protein BC835DRAFT_1521859 [Cytidiella melzeri]|nr:hypothetical protein BC835DRAFT_1521859 [Cytidiella melzeri]
MFVSKPRKVTLTLFCYLALVLAIASVAHADVPNHQARDHVGLSRMLKKRADVGDFLGASGAASDPPDLEDPSGGKSSSSTSAAVSTAGASVVSSAVSSSQSNTVAASAGASSVSSAVSSVASSSATSSASSVSVSASSSSGSSSASSTVSSSSSTSTPTSTAKTNNDATAEVDNNTAVSAATPSRVTVAVTATDSSTPSASSAAQAVGASSQSFPKTALTVIIVIASCIAAVAIGWTVIRKWKFKPSSSFEDRMAPIDWQPSNAADDGIPGLRRNVSSASHGSFQSGGHEDGFAGHGVGGYNATDSPYAGPGTTQLQPIPDHDFTAGPATLAPVGGYADLARGPSPQPQMSELSRGPSTNRGYDSYGVPLHHQGAYDYNVAGANRY